jgi:Tfp pilus assembly protein PilN
VSANVNTERTSGVASRVPASGGSVRVNLLPEATKARGRAAQQRAIAGLLAAVLLLGLAGTYWWAVSEVNDAESRLAAEQAVTADLRAEADALQTFSELATLREQADAVIIAALSDELAVAGVLQDIAAVIPTDAQLETLSVTGVPVAADAEPGAPTGTFTVTGKSLTSHAPGVERVLLQLDKVLGFEGLFLNSSTLDDPEARVATFSLDGQLGTAVRTGRYADGLPEELR